MSNSKKLYYDKGKLFLYAIGSLIFTISGIMFTLDQQSYHGPLRQLVFILAPLSVLLFLVASLYYLIIIFSNAPLIVIDKNQISINKFPGRNNIQWENLLVISRYESYTPNPGTYGLTDIKSRYIEILTKDNQKFYISPSASGKTLDEIINWIKAAYNSYENMPKVEFSEN